MLERMRLWAADKLVGKAFGGDGSLLTMLSAGASGSARRGTTELIAAYKTSPWLRAVVSKIAYHFGSITWRLYLPSRAAKTAAGKMFSEDRRKEMKALEAVGELKEIETHPLLDLLRKPNESMSGVAVRRVTQVWMDLKGEAFWELVRNKVGAPVGVLPYPPDWISDIPKEGADFFKLSGAGNMNRNRNIPRKDMVWFRDLDPTNPYLRGCGIGESLGDEIDTDEYAAKHLKRYFLNRAQPDLLISLKGAKQPELDAAQTTWDNKFRGYANAHRTMWTSGEITAKELQSSFKDMDLANLRSWERDLFISIYGVPPEILGVLSSSNRATIKEAVRIFACEVLVPRAEDFRMTLQSQLVEQYDERFVLDYDSPVPEDDIAEADVLKAIPYVATRGELRKKAGLEDRGDVDNVHIMQFNLIATPAAPKTKPAAEPAAAPAEEPVAGTEAGKSQPVIWDKFQIQKIKAIPEAASMLIAQILSEGLKPERLTDAVEPRWKKRVQEWGDKVLDELGLAVSFDLRNPLIADYLATWAAEKITGEINETTKDGLKAALTAGMEAGEGYKDLAKRVESVFEDAKGYRAEMIARTEAGQAASTATFAAYKQSGVVPKKQWIATPDGNARPDHEAMLGSEPIGIDEAFDVGGEALMYPCDPGGSAGNVINCRCAVVGVVDKPWEEEAVTAIWKQYDAERRDWERETVAAFVEGFDVQRKDMLDALASAVK